MLSPPLALVPGLPGKWADICWRVTGQQNIAEKPRVPNVSYVANMKPEADIDFIALRFQPCVTRNFPQFLPHEEEED